MIISLNNNIKINEWNLKIQENKISLNFFSIEKLGISKYIINHSININENIENQDIDHEYKSIFIF